MYHTLDAPAPVESGFDDLGEDVAHRQRGGVDLDSANDAIHDLVGGDQGASPQVSAGLGGFTLP